jgi:F-type H+-transporting ATPase subunit beta
MDTTSGRESDNLGTVLTIRGSVMDAHFPRQLPSINHQLAAGPGGSIAIEVVAHLSSEMVRGIALTPTHGLARGSPVRDLGHHLKVPVGDRQTGKTAIVLDTLINQKDTGIICVYCAIGQRDTAVAQLVADLRDQEVMDYCICAPRTCARSTAAAP